MIRGSQWERVSEWLEEFQVQFKVQKTNTQDVHFVLRNTEKWFPIDLYHDYLRLERKAWISFLEGVRMTRLYDPLRQEYAYSVALLEVSTAKGMVCTLTPRNTLCIREPRTWITYGQGVLGGRPALRLWSKVLISHPEDTVYTLGVEEDHSYVAGGMVVKNCFLVGTEDSVQGIYETLSDAAQISKWAGGLGIHVSDVRGKNSYIYGTNGTSNGILPMLKVFNNTARYIDQCFSEETLVFCEEGLKTIREIRPFHDRVLTKKGTFD